MRLRLIAIWTKSIGRAREGVFHWKTTNFGRNLSFFRLGFLDICEHIEMQRGCHNHVGFMNLFLMQLVRITVIIRTRFWMTYFCPCIVNRLVNRSTIYCGDFLAKIKKSSIQNSATPKPCILDDFGRRRTQIYRNKSRTNAAESAIRQGFGAGSNYYCYPRITVRSFIGLCWCSYR